MADWGISFGHLVWGNSPVWFWVHTGFLNSPIPMIRHMIPRPLLFALAACTILCATASAVAPMAPGESGLSEQSFRNPPDSARPWVYWVWLRANLDREGLKADLQALHRAGIRGVLVMMINFGPIPQGPVEMHSDEFHAIVQETLREAARLGIEVGFFTQEGWSTTGGPWVPVEDSMQMLVWSELQVAAGTASPKLVTPYQRHGFYRDARVVAYPTSASEKNPLSKRHPVVRLADGAEANAAALWDGDAATSLPVPAADGGATLTIELAEPMVAGRLRFVPGPGPVLQGQLAILQASDDGAHFRDVTSAIWPYYHPAGLAYPCGDRWQGSANFAPVTARWFRLVLPHPELSLAGLEILPPAAGDASIPAEGVLDLTSKLQPDGRLDWTAPAGDWTILRFGHTAIGSMNHPATPQGTGFEVDKMDGAAMERHIENGMLGRILREAGPLAGKTIRFAHIDSYENGEQNWTPGMDSVFQKSRGYDPAAWLPSLTGRTVGSVGETKSFQQDMRRTIADLWEKNNYGKLAEVMARHGMGMSNEPFGEFVADGMRVSGLAEMPMGEFWYRFGLPGDGYMTGPIKSASAGANLYGRKFVGAEAFTTGDWWDSSPATLKPLGDRAFSEGANRMIFHNSPAQPSTDPREKPGLLWTNGIYFMRNLTWFEQSRAWLDYLSRCQFLLQEGRAVVDVVYFAGDGGHQYFNGAAGLQEAIGPGRKFDPADKFSLSRMAVRDGRIVLPHGQEYRVLALPDQPTMSPGVLEDVARLVHEGATVVGPPPQGPSGLGASEEQKAQFHKLVDALWGPASGHEQPVRVTASSTFPGFSAENLVNRSSLDLPRDGSMDRAMLRPALAWLSLDETQPVIDVDLGQARRSDRLLVWNHNAPGESARGIAKARISIRENDDAEFQPLGEFEFAAGPDDGSSATVAATIPLKGRTVRQVRIEALENHGDARYTGLGAIEVVPVEDGSTGRAYGKGMVFPSGAGAPWGNAFARLKLPPDFESAATNMVFYHRRQAEEDWYFVSNQLDRPLVTDGLFRVSGKVPEIWDPVTGIRTDAPVWSAEADGRTRVRLELEPFGSTFVVFRREPAAAPHLVGVREDGAAPARCAVEVRSATLHNLASGQTVADLTGQVRGRIHDGRLAVNALTVDRWFNTVAERNLRIDVDAAWNGEPLKLQLVRGDTLQIPPPPNEAANGFFAAGADGKTRFLAREGGDFTFAWSDGKTFRQTVKSPPPPIALDGPWQVKFDPQWGGPDSISFPALQDWAKHELPGIRFYSGTAEYVINFQVPPGWLEQNAAVELDLGSVETLAEVQLNGRDLGVWWKPPFREIITPTLMPGDNELRVRVTNQWTNRLIGDAALPEEKRITRTTMRPYGADFPLEPSGLIGPVKLRRLSVVPTRPNP